MAIISGERSIPNTSTPASWRWPLTYPGPQPTSATGPPPASCTNSANNDRLARRYGLSSSSPRTFSAYPEASVSYDDRVSESQASAMGGTVARSGDALPGHRPRSMPFCGHTLVVQERTFSRGEHAAVDASVLPCGGPDHQVERLPIGCRGHKRAQPN